MKKINWKYEVGTLAGWLVVASLILESTGWTVLGNWQPWVAFFLMAMLNATSYYKGGTDAFKELEDGWEDR